MRDDARSRLKLVSAPTLREEEDPALAILALDPGTQAQAAREIVRRFGPMVHRILKRSLGASADVQDLVQEVFLRVFSRLHTLKDPQAFKQFVISITVHILKWELRRRDIRKLVGLSPSPEDFGKPVDGVNHDAREALTRFEAILGRLTPHERAVFVLRFMEELTLPEVAKGVGVSLATAKRHIDRIWARVMAAVAQDPVLSSYSPEDERGRA